jgi:hypothetical protein
MMKKIAARGWIGRSNPNLVLLLYLCWWRTTYRLAKKKLASSKVRNKACRRALLCIGKWRQSKAYASAAARAIGKCVSTVEAWDAWYYI